MYRRLAAFTLLAATTLSSQAADENMAPHGAMAMDQQEKRVDRLLADRPIDPSPGIDRMMWETLEPDDNEMTPERVALGKKLYFDTRLSADGTVACATCHDVSRGFTDQRPVSEGIGGALGRRNAPTTMNALLFTTQFLDGRSPSLEEQSKLPPINPIEMGQPDHEAVVAAIADDAQYRKMFKAAYGSEPNIEDIGKAIGAFERTLVFLDSRFDRYMAGDRDALTAAEKRGLALFNGKGRCASCHMINPSNPLGTDNRFHNIGVAARNQNFEKLADRALKALEKENGVEAVDRLALETDLSELGRFLVTKDRADIGAFKTTQLRNIGITAPYMHDGSMHTLWDVVDHYNKGGEVNPFLDGGIEPLALSESEIDDLVTFMFALTDVAFEDENEKAKAAQKKRAAEKRPFRDTDMAMRRVIQWEKSVAGKKGLTGEAPE